MPQCPECQKGLAREYDLEKRVEALEAALRASTNWLRTIGPELSDADFARITLEQIAANEAALGGG